MVGFYANLDAVESRATRRFVENVMQVADIF